MLVCAVIFDPERDSFLLCKECGDHKLEFFLDKPLDGESGIDCAIRMIGNNTCIDFKTPYKYKDIGHMSVYIVEYTGGCLRTDPRIECFWMHIAHFNFLISGRKMEKRFNSVVQSLYKLYIDNYDNAKIIMKDLLRSKHDSN